MRFSNAIPEGAAMLQPTLDQRFSRSQTWGTRDIPTERIRGRFPRFLLPAFPSIPVPDLRWFLALFPGLMMAVGGKVEILPQGSGTFSLLSYNVQARPVLDHSRARKNLPVIGRKLNAFDLAGVQECFSFGERLLDQTTHPTRSYFDRRQHWWSLANSGLLSVSRFPSKEVHTMFYAAKAELPDRVASKGILLIRYEFFGRTLDVYNTHMQAGNRGQAQMARAQQAEELVQFVSKLSPPDHAVIIHGDFNMGPSRPGKAWTPPSHYASEADMLTRTMVFSRMMKTLRLNDVSDRLFGPTLDHIDRVLFRNGNHFVLTPLSWKELDAEFRDAEGRPLSDSSPIAVRFRWSTH